MLSLSRAWYIGTNWKTVLVAQLHLRASRQLSNTVKRILSLLLNKSRSLVQTQIHLNINILNLKGSSYIDLPRTVTLNIRWHVALHGGFVPSQQFPLMSVLFGFKYPRNPIYNLLSEEAIVIWKREIHKLMIIMSVKYNKIKRSIKSGKPRFKRWSKKQRWQFIYAFKTIFHFE